MTNANATDGAGKPVDEIEITEAMIRAGEDQLNYTTALNLVEGFTSAHTVAIEVFQAMLLASRVKQ